MNREIKYKGWVDLGDGDPCMIDVEMIDFEKGLVRGRTSNSEVHAYLEFVKLLQYTGINDKNGVEICEVDIVVVTESGTNGFSSRHKVVNWTHENYPAFDLHPPVYDELNSFSAISSFGDHTVEVIGNIYENPELWDEYVNNGLSVEEIK